MRILLVEDDEFKASDILRALEEYDQDTTVDRAASVTSALRAITGMSYDLILLDMSLPTFDLSGPGGGGSPQGQGGVEVIRLARRLDRRCPIVINTQYPDIEIDGLHTPLDLAADKLAERFGLDVRRCVLYGFDRSDWRVILLETLRAL